MYSLQLSAYPGEQFQVEVEAFDELARPTATILRISEQEVSVGRGGRTQQICRLKKFGNLINFLILICSQEIAQHRFNPAVLTHDRIRDSRLNTSFFSLAGTLTEVNEVTVESLVKRVMLIMIS